MQHKNVVCPAWEDCNKKACIEQYSCMNIGYCLYPPPVKKEEIVKSREKQRKVNFFHDYPSCVKTGDWCDKKEACVILGQCIIKHPRVVGNNLLIKALKGNKDVGRIVKILREHDPEPFDSYYPRKKKVKK